MNNLVAGTLGFCVGGLVCIISNTMWHFRIKELNKQLEQIRENCDLRVIFATESERLRVVDLETAIYNYLYQFDNKGIIKHNSIKSVVKAGNYFNELQEVIENKKQYVWFVCKTCSKRFPVKKGSSSPGEHFCSMECMRKAMDKIKLKDVRVI